MMERIHDDRYAGLFINTEAVADRIQPFVILDYEPASE